MKKGDSNIFEVYFMALYDLVYVFSWLHYDRCLLFMWIKKERICNVKGINLWNEIYIICKFDK